MTDEPIEVGTVVRDRRWGGRYKGTVVARSGRSICVAWHQSCVEDELNVEEVDVVPDASAEHVIWRGGIGVLEPDGSFHVVPAFPPGADPNHPSGQPDQDAQP